MVQRVPEFANTTAFRNGTLQGAYFIIAARSLGLDCGPMSGSQCKGRAAFFLKWKLPATTTPSGVVRSNFLCNLGYGDESKLFHAVHASAFDETCQLLKEKP